VAAPQIVRVDLMDESNFKWHRAFVLLVVALSGAMIGSVGGFEYRDRIQKHFDAQPKPRPVVMNPPPFLIGCDRSAVEEVARTCRARLRSGKVGGL
jgi:hypothetical protein